MTEPPFSTTLILLRDAKAGQVAALDDLLARYADRIKRAAALTLGHLPNDAADLDDIVQEVLLAAFRNFDRFEIRSDGSFMGWLMTIVLNKVRDLHRHAGRQIRGGGKVRRLADLVETGDSGLPIPDPAPSPSQVARAHELEDAEQHALIELPSRYREVIVYHDLLGMSYAEIAPKLGYKTDAPPRALHNRARKRLATMLGMFRETEGEG